MCEIHVNDNSNISSFLFMSEIQVSDKSNDLSGILVVIRKCIYLYSCLTLRLVELSEGSESAKIQPPGSRV